MSTPLYVLDASVGVKWFRDERGSDEARALIEDHIDGRAVLAVNALFGYEVLSAASRDHHPEDVERIWRDLAQLDAVTVPLGDDLVRAAAAVRGRMGCTLYDAFSAGLADLLGAVLCSADRRAHGAYPGVRLIGVEPSADETG